ncbi:hypothetical protein BCR44DRAFT_1291042 [Catenaria anguillulae PL171]|uniref:Peptidase A2 domain-containing protein n=1 Tax=Catenaria anguillulae PL171 TaxID=765915 RepID=A0A1Y2HAC3_9FUNG|nr:hypothetical protein BCR44DRAFT_1291042 [Catenaria anguillulae PL171]
MRWNLWKVLMLCMPLIFVTMNIVVLISRCLCRPLREQHQSFFESLSPRPVDPSPHKNRKTFPRSRTTASRLNCAASQQSLVRVDSGADCNILPAHLLDPFRPYLMVPSPADSKLAGIGGGSPPLGHVDLLVRFHDRAVVARFHVHETAGHIPILIGNDTFPTLGIGFTGIDRRLSLPVRLPELPASDRAALFLEDEPPLLDKVPQVIQDLLRRK